ncbi:ABC transporter substrate-binding protein [Salidesulfovibrio onnuriiensis]|uniref:ABC transporter substrate-binding protein n=1 Tax=Salidesulfovibrio onnuriiensis TaxID=2583823 RepID=UPI0011CB83E2|nr:ABC transporter substrate-binding protein [Salidesulfovibrio onnuriiensis]
MRIPATLLFLLLAALPARAASVTDHAGRTLDFDRPFSRIISLYAAHTENLFELGLDREIIGVSRGEDYPATALSKPAFNARDGVERFLAAKPDLVLIRPMHWRGYPALWEALGRAGIAVAVLQPGNVDEMYAYWKTLGALSGREKAATAMTERFRAGLAQARQALATIPKTGRPKVFFESIHRKLSTFSPGSMALFVLGSAGGVNAAPDAEPRHGTNVAAYGKERILAKAEDIDVYVSQSGTMNQVTVRDIVDEPGFSSIRAVREGRVFLMDERLVSRPTSRLLHGIRTLHGLLYPQTP